jgi:hypothetical protein
VAAKVEMEALILARPVLAGTLPMRKTHMPLRFGFGRNVITPLVIIQPDRSSRRSSANH